jgi:hypothetical protein
LNEETSLSELVCEVEGLHEGVQIAGGTLILETNISRLLFGIIVCKIVPQHTRLILNKANISGNICGIIFAEGSAAAFPRDVEHASVLNKPCEAPITLFLGEAVMSSVMDV